METIAKRVAMSAAERNHMQAWDANLAAVFDDMTAIKSFQLDSTQKERLALISLKVGIFQLQGRLAQLLDRISDLTPQQNLVPTRQRAFLYWSITFANKVRAYYAEQVTVLGKEMWLNLVRARVPGDTGQDSLDFSDDNLVELSLRFSHLQATQQHLQNFIIELQQQQAKLRHRYQDISAARANREAACSMHANFGAT